MIKILDKLNIIKIIKESIKASIEAKGVEVGNAPFEEYADKIDTISGGKYDEAYVNLLTGNTTEIIFPEGIASLRNYAFAGLPKVTSVEVPNTVRFLGLGVFYTCPNLTYVKLPNGITSIGSSMFQACSKLTTVEIPDTVTQIGSMAFTSTGITNITVPSGVTTIPMNCFGSCKSLKTVEILGNVTSFAASAFVSDTALEKVILRNVTSVPTITTNVFASSSIATGTGYVYVPDSLVDSFKTAANWKTYANQIKPLSELD